MRAEINLYNEDCLQAMRAMQDKQFDLAIVDPPYGYSDAKTDMLNFRQKEQHREWNIAPKQEYFEELFRVSKNQIVWGGNYFSYLWNFGGRCFIYWHKGNPVPNFADGELAWTSFDKNAKQLNYRYYGNLEGKSITSQKFHPTQKPIHLYKWVLENFAEKGQKIIDTHLGSGSIAVACWDMGFDLTAYEIDKEYYDAACKRFNEHRRQMQLW